MAMGMRRPGAMVPAVVFAGTLTASCDETTTHQFRYPSPKAVVWVVVVPDGEREPAEGRANLVYLEGAAPPKKEGQTGYPPSDKVRLGTFVGRWNPAAIAWIDETTVNVCPLEGDRTVPATADVLATETTRRTYRITTDCPAFLRKAAPRLGLPKSY